MPADSALEIASRIVHNYATPGCTAVEHLTTYHGHQMEILTDIFSKLKKHTLPAIGRALLRGEPKKYFENDMVEINRYIFRLERTLRAGSLLAWCKYEETQNDLAKIQRRLAHHLNNGGEYRERINKARDKDTADTMREINELVLKFNSTKKRRMPWGRSIDSYLSELVSEVLKVPADVPGYRYYALGAFLDKFTAPSDTLANFIGVLKAYLEEKLQDIDRTHFAKEFKFQVLRKPSGSIIAILLGSKSPDVIQEIYCPEMEDPEKLPMLYTSTSHEGNRGFVVAQQAIQNRPDSRRYVVWNHGPATDIYLVEKFGSDPFILATLLGPDMATDEVISLPRHNLAIRDVLCPRDEDQWISDDGWSEFSMEGLLCNSPQLLNFHHQIFIPGPPTPAPRR